jgi:hypothetical protein
LLFLGLLALAAAIGAAVLAAGLSAIAFAAVIAVHGLRLEWYSLRKRGGGKSDSERNKCDGPFHRNSPLT